MLVAARDSEEISWPHALFASVISIEISAFDTDYPYIAGMCVHSRVVPRRELRVCSVSPLVWLAPEGGHGAPIPRWHLLEGSLLRSHVDRGFLVRARRFLTLRHTYRCRSND